MINWPAKKNWKEKVIGKEISILRKHKFESAANITCKTKKPENFDSELLNLLTVKRIGERPNKDHPCPNALDMIRCGIGANYSGEYYDEVYDLVLKPILDYVNKQQGH